MSAPTAATRATPTISWASSNKFRTFAITFSTVGPVIYMICLFMNWPLFTFHPATNRFAWWLEAARSGEGPNMTWYGWTVMAVLVAAFLGFLATLLPEGATKRFPLILVWLLPWLAIPLMIYDLRFWWLHS